MDQADRALLCSLLDLTSLHAIDQRQHIMALCERAIAPGPGLPPVAAVCVHADRADVAVTMLSKSPVRVAAVAGAFPHGRSPLSVRLAEIEHVAATGADEIDVVIDRAKVLASQWGEVAQDLKSIRKAAGETTLKIILEVSEIPDPEMLRAAGKVALDAGADFLKTSTGMAGGATIEAVDVLLDAIAHHGTGGIKVSGGVRTGEQAKDFLHQVIDTLGPVGSDRFRIGASSLLDELIQ